MMAMQSWEDFRMMVRSANMRGIYVQGNRAYSMVTQRWYTLFEPQQHGIADELPPPPGGYVPRPEQVDQETQTWAQELQRQVNIETTGARPHFEKDW